MLKNNVTGRIMTAHRDGSGYLYYSLLDNGKINKVRIHTLLFRTFVNNRYDRKLFVVDHISCDKENNNLYNLRLLSYSENTKEYYQAKEDCAKFRNQNKSNQKRKNTIESNKQQVTEGNMSGDEDILDLILEVSDEEIFRFSSE